MLKLQKIYQIYAISFNCKMDHKLESEKVQVQWKDLLLPQAQCLSYNWIFGINLSKVHCQFHSFVFIYIIFTWVFQVNNFLKWHCHHHYNHNHCHLGDGHHSKGGDIGSSIFELFQVHQVQILVITIIKQMMIPMTKIVVRKLVMVGTHNVEFII